MNLDKYNIKLQQLALNSKVIPKEFKFEIKEGEDFAAFIVQSATSSTGIFKINLENMNKLTCEEQDFILSHELGHLEYFLENPKNIKKYCKSYYFHSNDCIMNIKLNNKLLSFNPATQLSNIFMISTISGLYIKKLKIFPLSVRNKISIPLLTIPSLYSLSRMCFYYSSRKMEYDADKRAFNMLGTNSGGIKIFNRFNNKWYDNFIYLTHPTYYNRIKKLKSYDDHNVYNYKTDILQLFNY